MNNKKCQKLIIKLPNSDLYRFRQNKEKHFGICSKCQNRINAVLFTSLKLQNPGNANIKFPTATLTWTLCISCVFLVYIKV